VKGKGRRDEEGHGRRKREGMKEVVLHLTRLLKRGT
jgi:hypothetical protein